PQKITDRLEQNGDRIFDLHLWRVGPGHVAGIVSLVSSHPQDPSAYKSRLADLHSLSHVTIEVERAASSADSIASCSIRSVTSSNPIQLRMSLSENRSPLFRDMRYFSCGTAGKHRHRNRTDSRPRSHARRRAASPQAR